MQDLKEDYRSRFIAERRALSHAAVSLMSRQVAARLVGSPLFERCGAILLYSAIGHEVDPTDLRHAAEAAGKAVYYPRVLPDTDRLTFFGVAPGEALRPGRWAIGEPVGGREFHCGTPALAVVPGVAFDRTGTRLGRGGGYYDRALRQLGDSCASVGLAFGLQLVPTLPREAHDEAVCFVATETELFPCAPPHGSDGSRSAEPTKEAP